MKTVISISDMHCSGCAMTIDDELEKLAGVKRAKTNYARSRSEVEYDAEQVSLARMIEAVKAAGYAGRAEAARG